VCWLIACGAFVSSVFDRHPNKYFMLRGDTSVQVCVFRDYVWCVSVFYDWPIFKQMFRVAKWYVSQCVMYRMFVCVFRDYV
jgi:hypothetical protein